MPNRSIGILLLSTVCVATVLPLIAAFYFLDRALQTSLNLGFNRQIVQTLDEASQNLRALRTFDPGNQSSYRQQFDEITKLRNVYSDPELLKGSILGSLRIYFALGLVGAVALSVLIAGLLSRRIARAYATTFDELMRRREQVRYLEEISSWQELAKMLAHEIKNPLTPIEVLVTSLSKSYLNKTAADFQEQLQQTESMIGEELGHLKNIVNRFSEFARLPQVHLVETSAADCLTQQVRALGATFADANIRLDTSQASPDLRIRIDATLFRQVLINLVKNGLEANPGKSVVFCVTCNSQGGSMQISISNDGEPVPADLAPRIFDPYISGKGGKDNMGLGLAIVKKIVIEHGGEISYVEKDGHPVFVIALPRFA